LQRNQVCCRCPLNSNAEPSMSATLTQTDELVRRFIVEYFEAWSGIDEDAILAYYSDDVILEIPRAKFHGKLAVRDQFVRPFIAAFPGNNHVPCNMAFTQNLVAVEWFFEAVHRGPFATIPPTGRQLKIPGCSIYEHDISKRVITAGRIYFD